MGWLMQQQKMLLLKDVARSQKMWMLTSQTLGESKTTLKTRESQVVLQLELEHSAQGIPFEHSDPCSSSLALASTAADLFVSCPMGGCCGTGFGCT